MSGKAHVVADGIDYGICHVLSFNETFDTELNEVLYSADIEDANGNLHLIRDCANYSETKAY